MIDIETIPADYVILKDEATGNYIAYGCRPGLRDYIDKDASTVIQSAIDALTDGGKIFIKPGIYLISTTLRIHSHIHIEGVFGKTILKTPDGANIAILANDALYVGDTSNVDEDIMLKNLVFDGNGANQTADLTPDNGVICFKNLKDSVIDGVIVRNGYGFNLIWNSVSDPTEGANLPVNLRNKITNSWFIYNQGTHDLVSIGGWRYGTISNSVFGESATGAGAGLTFGSIAYSTLSNIVVYERGHALSFESMGGDGCHDVVVNNVVALNVSRGLFIWKNTQGANPKTPYKITVRNLHVINASDMGVLVKDGYDFDINAKVYNVTGYDGIRVENCIGYVRVKGIVDTVARHGIAVTSTTSPVTRLPKIEIDAEVRNASDRGIFLAYVDLARIKATVERCKVGLQLYHDGTTPTVKRAEIYGEYKNNKAQGIWLAVTDGAYVEAILLNNGQDTSLADVYRCGLLINDAKNIEVHSKFIDDQATPTQQYGVSRFGTNSKARFINCVFQGLGVGAFSGIEADWVLKHNVGFVTENSVSKSATIPIGGGQALVTVTISDLGLNTSKIKRVLNLRIVNTNPVIPDVYAPQYGINTTEDAVGITLAAGTGTTITFEVLAEGY